MALSGHTSYAWVPDGIISFTMHMRGKIHDQRRPWARARLEHNGLKTNIQKIEFLHKEERLIMSAEGFRYTNMAVESRAKVKT